MKDIPVIVYTTSSAGKDKQVCKDLGAKEFIVKPGEYDQLVETLKKVLG